MFVANYEICLLWFRTSETLCQRPLNILSSATKYFILEGILNFSDCKVKNLTTVRKKKGWNEVPSLET